MGRLPKKVLLPAVLMVCFSAASCRRGPRPIDIAVAVPLTGDMASEGRGILKAVQLAVDEANRAKALPRKLEVVAFDDRGSPREAANVAQLIVSEPGFLAVIGPYTSDCALESSRVYATAGIPMITPAATNPAVTLQQSNPGWPGPRVVFRVVPTDDVQGAFAARFVYERLKKRRVALAYDLSAYGMGLAKSFRKTFEELGGRVVGRESFAVGQRDFAGEAAALRKTGAQAVYFSGIYPEAALLVRAMRDGGWGAPFISGDGANTPEFFDIAGPASQGAYVTTLGAPPRGSRRVASESSSTAWEGLKGLGPFAPFAYEAAEIVIEALKQSGPSRSGLLLALHKIRYRGLLGAVSFDAIGNARSRALSMARADYDSRRFLPVSVLRSRPAAKR
jgi:branched-chain amino acid transport system substrate-binding protein